MLRHDRHMIPNYAQAAPLQASVRKNIFEKTNACIFCRSCIVAIGGQGMILYNQQQIWKGNQRRFMEVRNEL
jgi:hypothetical protein